MSILLTGANGFLGKSILKEVSVNDFVFTLSRKSGDYRVFLENEIPDFKNIFKVIIHAAGKAHSIPTTLEEKKEFHDVNYEGTSNLLKGLERSGLPKEFVFISSVAVYGQESGINISENHPLHAQDPYGLSKIKAEDLVKRWCEDNHVICTILRLPLLVGKTPPGNLGAMIKAIKKGYYFNIGQGGARKSMVLTKDIALIISTVSGIGGTYNLTDGYHPSFYELSLAISKKNRGFFSLPVFIAKLLGKIGDLIGEKAPINSLKIMKITSDLTFDDSKARELLNWKPQNVLDYLKNEDLDSEDNCK
ncbi:UDP-galactose-4-epimerase [Flavobacterium tructae]|uniref:NAD-dependent epimerase/dehydratase family protein n=1 Tax=Flavobacterium tructae TaxID=1114873 RepID=UPI000B5B9BE3|nr:NAD-dependent epimerase/dehydratase family protein [Flavobacterium tructae]OXB20761.1 UDP-galactose-4-epimerase [Flavobacterium tructae]